MSRDPAVADALAHDRVVDITTIGRRTGEPRRIEIWMWSLEDRLYISGWPDLPRGWYANLLADQAFTLHLKRSVVADLAARARPVTDPGERLSVLRHLGELGDIDAMVTGSPLIEVLLEP